MEEPFDAGGVRGVLHRPANPGEGAFVLTHGAGSNAHAPLLVRLARAFADAGCLVLRYDLPFRQQRPKGPPYPAAAARDREGVAQAIQAIRGLALGPIYAGGQSYGGRQTAMAAAERPGSAQALLLLSYPLHPPGKPGQMRTSFFAELQTPALFVHGTRDPFGSPEELLAAIPLIPARTDVLLVEGAGHDLKGAGELAAQILARLKAL
ncbi:MAG TPA: alpha/beta family hydrolase [Candidatus Acidoferrales bacterium]|nr:alpha/beta family hydrolase [Candidatus Acidoferrales bacterium]